MTLVFNEATMLCCGMSRAKCECGDTTSTPPKPTPISVNQADILPDLWEESRAEDRRRLAKNANYLGKASRPPDTEAEAPEPFVGRNFEDLLMAEPIRPATLVPESQLVVNLPPVDRNNIIPMPTINWEEEQKARLQSYVGKGRRHRHGEQ